ncbi:MAG: hypothetical protein WCF62_08300 [Pseudolabrys sp.]
MNIDHELVLVSARKSRGSNHWGNDDYDVRRVHTRGPVVGRIFRSTVAPTNHQTETLEIDRTWLCRDACGQATRFWSGGRRPSDWMDRKLHSPKG